LRPPSVYKYDLLFRRLKAFATQEGPKFLDELNLETLCKFRATWNHKNFAARNALQALPANGDYYFWRGGAKPKARVGNFQGMLPTVFKDVEVTGGHAHRFRDTFAVELLLAGVSLEKVAALLGNSVKIVEKHYAPWVAARQDQLEEAVRAKLDGRYKITSNRKSLAKNPIKLPLKLAGAGGLEPPPSSLTVRCPTDWTTPQLVCR
jgi:hypothetical protein